MKKVFSFILALLIMFSLTACGGDTDENDTKAPSDSTVETDIDAETDASTEDNTNNEQITSEEAAIEETVLVDEAGIKITANELSYDGIFGTELKLLIENNTEKSLTVQARNSSVNGYMIENMMSVDVAAGKKANDSLTFMSSDLEACGIETIADIEFSFNIFGSDDWETYLDTAQIQLKTSIAESYEYIYDDAGTTVYEDNGIKIVVKGISENDSFFGPGLVLYIHNSSERAVTVQAGDVSINGFMVESIFSQDLLPDKHAVTAVTFMSSDLEENGITEITEAELFFHIFDMDSWDTIVDTDLITLDF